MYHRPRLEALLTSHDSDMHEATGAHDIRRAEAVREAPCRV